MLIPKPGFEQLLRQNDTEVQTALNAVSFLCNVNFTFLAVKGVKSTPT